MPLIDPVNVLLLRSSCLSFVNAKRLDGIEPAHNNIIRESQ